LATCQVTLWRAAWLLATRQPATAALAVAKVWAAEAGYRVSTAAQHLHGGIGVATDYPLHRYLRRARHNELALGGAGAQLAALGRQLAEGGPDS
jgi:alkylation response protein AidB-like acyl-CoA dehydrogenase